jgi:aspartyl-tRNA(Asn)/glutamyl-tRNA(Gln) amidotransferase subunit A
MNGGLSQSWRKTAAERDAKVGAFLQFAPDLGAAVVAAAAPAGPLAGVPFAVKDNIAVRGYQLTCGSKLLEGLVSPYSATVVERLVAAGAVPVGKTNCDEFGMGSSTENSAYRKTVNPWDASRVPGGSSGGSAAAVAAGIVPFALGSDTGGSVRQPASFCGIYGLKPTWGAVSRYGLVAYASSLDVVGVAAKTVAFARAAFVAMRGEDPLDHSSLPWPPAVRAGAAPVPRGSRGLRIGIPREASGPGLHPDVASALGAAAGRLRSLGHEVIEVTLPTLGHVVAAYYVIATAEASANLARFDGVRYGRRAANAINPEQLVIASRSAGFGDEVKLRILLGTFVLRSGFQDQYYLQALKVRTLIRRDFERCFGGGGAAGADLLLMPAYPVPPFAPGSADADPFAQKLADVFTCSANLAGLPALAFPAAVEHGLPIGMQLLAPAFGEDLLLDTAAAMEKVFPSPDPPGFPAFGPWERR